MNTVVVGVEIHNYLDTVTSEAAVADIQRSLVEAVTAVLVLAVVDTQSLVEVEVVEVDKDSRTQCTLCMELGLLLPM